MNWSSSIPHSTLLKHMLVCFITFYLYFCIESETHHISVYTPMDMFMEEKWTYPNRICTIMWVPWFQWEVEGQGRYKRTITADWCYCIQLLSWNMCLLSQLFVCQQFVTSDTFTAVRNTKPRSPCSWIPNRLLCFCFELFQALKCGWKMSTCISVFCTLS